MRLKDQSAIVTGAASGFGAAIAERFAAEGARVVVADLNEAQGQAVALRIGGVFARCDVSRAEDVQALVQALSLIPLSEPTRLRRNAYAVFCWKKKKNKNNNNKWNRTYSNLCFFEWFLGSSTHLPISVTARIM